MTTLIIVGCAGPRQLSAEAFEREYQNAKIIHSAQSYNVLGVEDGKAYLSRTRVGSFGGPGKTKVFVTDLAGLPTKTQQELLKK
jgi:hypothetical protein